MTEHRKSVLSYLLISLLVAGGWCAFWYLPQQASEAKQAEKTAQAKAEEDAVKAHFLSVGAEYPAGQDYYAMAGDAKRDLLGKRVGLRVRVIIDYELPSSGSDGLLLATVFEPFILPCRLRVPASQWAAVQSALDKKTGNVDLLIACKVTDVVREPASLLEDDRPHIFTVLIGNATDVQSSSLLALSLARITASK